MKADNQKKKKKKKPDIKLVPEPPAGSSFRLWRMIEHWTPHAFVIGTPHMTKSKGGFLDPTVAPCQRCHEAYSKHTCEWALLMVIPNKFKHNPREVPGLQAYVVSLKETMEKLGIAGVGFATQEDYERENPVPNAPVWPPRLGAFIPGSGEWIKIKAGLTKLRGNKKAYFSITGSTHTAGGCIHEQIKLAAPEWEPVIRLHLADEDGVPTHVAANGFYWLRGGFFMHPGEWSPITYQRGDQYGEPMSREDLDKTLAGHLRISIEEAVALRIQVEDVMKEAVLTAGDYIEDANVRAAIEEAGKAALAAWVEERKPWWKHEAEEVIAKFKLQRKETW